MQTSAEQTPHPPDSTQSRSTSPASKGSLRDVIHMTQKKTVRELADLVGGSPTGDLERDITGARPLQDCRQDDVTFLEDEKYLKLLTEKSPAAVVVHKGIECAGVTTIVCENPFEAFAVIVASFRTPPHQYRRQISSQCSVASTAQLGEEVHVGTYATVGEDSQIGARSLIHSGVRIGNDVILGDDCVVFPNAVILDGTRIGDRVTIHSGAVIGSDGFGFRPHEGKQVRNPQLGYVELGDDVEVGANTTIDRSTFHVTRIGQGTKIDNLVQIAHNCQIGKFNMIVAQVGIAGSTRTGDGVIIAGQAGLRDHLTVGDGAIIGAMAGVMRDIDSGEHVVGIPATPEREQMRIQVALLNLPKLRAQVRDLSKEIKGLKDSA